MDEKDKVIAEQALLIQKLLARIEELERMLGLHSGNSSKPPSSDGLRKKPAPQSLRVKGKKKSGGQQGHKGHTLKQTPFPDHTINHEVKVCEKCANELTNCSVDSYIKRQIIDIPQPKIEITEHQASVKICKCGHRNIATFPTDVTAPVQYGNQIKTFSVYLNQQQLIPEDRLQSIFFDMFKLSISTATLVSFNHSFSSLVEPIQKMVLENLKLAPIKHADETSIRIEGKTEWMHVTSNNELTHYRVEKRGDILSGLRGIIIHDHWKPYFKLTDVIHALCNAHHLRELTALEEIEKEPWAFLMTKFLQSMNHMQAPPIEQALFIYDAIVRQGLAFHEGLPPVSLRKNKRRVGHNLLLRFRDYKDAVLRFLTIPGVPFTNNLAEQDIRMMKVRQKISGCFRTALGAKIFCIIRGFISTCRKQGRNLFQDIQQTFSGKLPAFS